MYAHKRQARKLFERIHELMVNWERAAQTVGRVQLVNVELVRSESVEHVAVKRETVRLAHIVNHYSSVRVHGGVHDTQRWQRRGSNGSEQLHSSTDTVQEARPEKIKRCKRVSVVMSKPKPLSMYA